MKVLWIHGEGRYKRHLEVWQSWHKVLQEELGLWHPGAKVLAAAFPLTDWLDRAADADEPTRQEAVAHLAQGQAIRGMGDVLRGTQVVSAASEQLADCANLIMAWVRNPRLRLKLRDQLELSLREQASSRKSPLLVIAAGASSLVVYDCLVRNPGLARKCLLVTLGSPLGHPTVRNVYGGRIVPVDAVRWYHLHNPHDRSFATSLTLKAPQFIEVLTPFITGDGSLNHEVIAAGTDRHGYLDHPAAREWLWPDVLRRTGLLSSNETPPSLGRTNSRFTTKAAKSSSSVFQPTHRALLIGIDRYQHSSIPELKGCVNDTYLMSSVLQECGMAPEQIRMLHNERATASSIRERLDWLLEGHRQEIAGCFFFSGHGAQLESYSTGEVVDRQDECLVAHDFNFTRDSAIVDDDLWRLYSQLPYDADFVAIMDCCHAGGTHRGPQRVRGIEPPGDIRHRGMQWNAELSIWEERPLSPLLRATHGMAPKSRTMQPDDKARYFGKNGILRKIGRANVLRQTDDDAYDSLRAELGHNGPYLPILLQACQEAELAAEYDHGSVSHGAFTYCTAQALRELGLGGRGVTFQQLLKETRKRMQRLGFTQTPVLLGPRRKTGRAIPLPGRKSPSRTARKVSARKGWQADEKASADYAAALPIYPVANNLPAALPAPPRTPSTTTSQPPPAPPRMATRDVLNPGNDQRHARDSEHFPWRAVSYLEATFQSGETFRGSGFCVGQRLLLTAGHCLLGPGNRAVSINVFPGLQHGRTVAEATTSTVYRVHPRWETLQDPEFDYGMVMLPSSAPWIGTRVLSNVELTGMNCFVAGYPVDRSLNVWAAAGLVQAAGDTLLSHRIDSENGQSGGPIFHVTDELDAFVVGIHTQGTPTLNHGIRFTEDVLTQVLAWADELGMPIP